MKTSRLLFRIHSYFGLITGVFLLLLGLSGSALVFMEELDEWLNQDLLTVQAQAKPLPLDSLYQKITQRYPRLDGLAWINPSAKANEAYNFRLYTTDGKLHTYDLELITLNPYTAEVLRDWEKEKLLGKPNAAIQQSFDDMWTKAQKAMPDLKPTYVYFPTQADRNFNIIGEKPGDWALFGASNAVIVDPKKGAIIAISTLDKATWSEKLEAVVFPLHVGSFGGLPIRILYVLIGLTPGLLSITGFLLWWRGRRKKRPKYVKLNARA